MQSFQAVLKSTRLHQIFQLHALARMPSHRQSQSEVLIERVTVIGQISLAVMIGHLVLFIWQIRNSGKLCKEYNECLEQHGQSPW